MEGSIQSTPASDTGSQQQSNAAPVTGQPGSQGELTNNQAKTLNKAAQAGELPEEMLDKVYTVTIDGQPKQLTVREMARLTQFEQASQKRFREASDMNKKTQGLIDLAVNNPEEFFRKTGRDPEVFAEEVIRRKIEEMKMSPEQRKQADDRRQFEEQKKQWEGQVQTRVRDEIDHEMTTAFQKSNLPKSPFLAARMAALVHQSILNAQQTGSQPLSYPEAADKVKVWFRNSLRESLGGMDPKGILDFLGPEMVRNLQNALVSQVSGAAPTADSVHRPSGAEQAKSKNNKKPVKFTHWKDYQKYIESL